MPTRHIAVVPVELAAAQAAQVALQAGQVDIIVVDWLWVARQRGAGADWTFVPFSDAVGALDRTGRFAGSRHAGSGGTRARHSRQSARQELAHSARLREPAIRHRPRCRARTRVRPSPLLAEQMKAGRLDALLTYWPFAAKAEADGARRDSRRGRCGQRARDRRRRALYRLYILSALGGAEPGADRRVHRRVAPGARDPRDVGCRMAAHKADDRRCRKTPNSNGCGTGIGAACRGIGASRSAGRRTTVRSVGENRRA